MRRLWPSLSEIVFFRIAKYICSVHQLVELKCEVWPADRARRVNPVCIWLRYHTTRPPPHQMGTNRIAFAKSKNKSRWSKKCARVFFVFTADDVRIEFDAGAKSHAGCHPGCGHHHHHHHHHHCCCCCCCCCFPPRGPQLEDWIWCRCQMGSWQGSQLMVAKPAIASRAKTQFTHPHLLSLHPQILVSLLFLVGKKVCTRVALAELVVG